MDIYEYKQFLLDVLPETDAEQTLEFLHPLAHIPIINPYLNVARIKSSKTTLLCLLDNLPISSASAEGFSFVSAVKGSVGHVGKVLSTAVITALTYALINNKTMLSGLLIELKRLKNPKLLMGVEMPLPSAEKYPINKVSITLNDIKSLVEKHFVMLKAVNAFINSSKFHVTTIPDVNHTQWLAGLRSMGGDVTEGVITSPILYGNKQITTTYNATKWSSKVATVTPTVAPTKFVNPGPLGLVGHVSFAEKAVEELWTMDSTLADSVTDVYNSIDKKRGNGDVKRMFRATVHTYYGSVLSATLALTLAYSHACKQATETTVSKDTDK